MFWRRPYKEKKRVNVGKATIHIIFTDNTSETIEKYGNKDIPAKYVAKEYMSNIPRNNARVYSNDYKKMVFKDVRSVEIIKIEDYFLDI